MTSSPPRGANSVATLNGPDTGRSAGRRILAECREAFVVQTSNWLRELASPIAEELFVLADSTRDRQLQSRYLNLRADVEGDWPRLVDAFNRHLANGCGTALAPRGARWSSEVSAGGHSFDGLSLMDDEELTERIVIREFAAQLAETCDEELYALNRRVAALLGQEEVAAPDNPLSPAIVCQSLSDACGVIGSDSDSRLLLLRRVERHLHRGMPPIYRGINASLIERGILPDLKRSYRKRDLFGQQRPAPPTASAAGAMAHGTGSDGTPLPSGHDIMETLQRLAQRRDAGAPLGGAGATTLRGGNASGIAPALDETLLASLNALQHSPPHASPGDTPIINQIRLVRESESARHVGGLESVTLDVVAMLFDFIFDDSHVPMAVKALLSRLQIPVLKVAMLNPGFFADRQHPTRKFLGSISGISIRWGQQVAENDPFYVRLAALIERILNNFEKDVDIFGTALAELDSFVSERENEEDSATLAATPLVLRREQEAAAMEKATKTTGDFCKTTALPPLVSQFLTAHWSALLQAAVLDDESGAAWQAAEQTMRDLAWSVEPKRTPDDRLKLIGLLPKLLGEINRGLDKIALDTEPRQAFFNQLVHCHSSALKGDAQALGSLTTGDPRAGEALSPLQPGQAASPHLQVTRRVDGAVELEEITLVGGAPAWRTDEKEIIRRVAGLRRGDWVEFSEPSTDETGDTIRYRERLHWVSPQKGILLFSNRRSAAAISITPEALARQIREGRAAILEATDIFESALSGALASISAA